MRHVCKWNVHPPVCTWVTATSCRAVAKRRLNHVTTELPRLISMGMANALRSFTGQQEDHGRPSNVESFELFAEAVLSCASLEKCVSHRSAGMRLAFGEVGLAPTGTRAPSTLSTKLISPQGPYSAFPVPPSSVTFFFESLIGCVCCAPAYNFLLLYS